MWYSLLYAGTWGWIVFRLYHWKKLKTYDVPNLFFFLFTTYMVFHWITFTHMTINRYKDLIKTFHDMSALYTFRYCSMWYFSLEGTGQVLDFKTVSEIESRNPWVSHPVLWALGFLVVQSNPQGSFGSGLFHGFESSVTHWIHELAVLAVYCCFRGLPQVQWLW